MSRTVTDIQEIVAKDVLFQPLRRKTILITGATGFIGSMIIKTLIFANQKYDLSMTIVGQIRSFKKAELIYGDLINAVKLVTQENENYDYIIHTASPTSSKYFIEHPVETIKASVESTIKILDLAKLNDATVVYLSSMEQYGIPYENYQVMTEDKVGIIDHLNVRSSYSESKRLCECLCASYASEYDLNVKIARLAQTFGSGMVLTDNRMPMQFTKAAIKSEDIVLHTNGKSIINFIYLTDAITGILTILLIGEKGQAYNVCNDAETRNVRRIAELVAKDIVGGRINVKIKEKENTGYAPNVKMYLNSDKLRSLGWQAEVNMKEAYERFYDYLSEEYE